MSPLLANMALDGMERLFDGEDTRGNPQRPSWKTGPNKGISLTRYADDLVVVAPSREVLEQHVLPTLTAFLQGRGLQLSEAKTRMVHSTEGLNFLGFEIKRYKRALLTPPQKAKVYGHDRTMKTDLQQHRQSPAAPSIRANADRRHVDRAQLSLIAAWIFSARSCAAASRRCYRRAIMVRRRARP